MGLNAGYANTTGDSNVCIGLKAGDTYANESRCTFVGYGADASANSYTNSGAFGFNATVNAPNKIQIGDGNVTVTESVNFYSSSDGRFKSNVQQNVKGLDFIQRLRPVTYQLNTGALDGFKKRNLPQVQDSSGSQAANIDYSGSSAVIRCGFIAQEVEQAATDANFTTDIVHIPVDTNDNYSLSYGGFVVPLVKAVQEQQEMIDDLTSENEALNDRLTELETIVGQCCPGSQFRMGSNSENAGQENTQVNVIKTDLKSGENIVLYQNEPNPFEGHTAIRYFLPNRIGSAFIVFHNEFGIEIKRLEILEKGFGRIEATTEELSSGIFTYSLVVDGNVIDTKKMVNVK